MQEYQWKNNLFKKIDTPLTELPEYRFEVLVSLCTHLVRLDKEEYDVKEKIRAEQVRLERFLIKIGNPKYVNFFKTSQSTNKDGLIEKDNTIESFNEY